MVEFPMFGVFIDSPASLGHIASVVGNPLHLDSLTENQSKLSYARICVEVGVECEFPKSVLLDMGNGKYSKIRIEYPWAPQCYSNCKRFGHSLVNCHALKGPSSKTVTINPGNSENEAGEEVLAGDRKDPQDTGEGSRKESEGDTLDTAADSVVNSIVECRGAIKPTVTYTDEVISLVNDVVNHPITS